MCIRDRCDSDEPAGQQCQNTRGVAADPSNGLIYVADFGNSRIVQFSAWGTFLRAWGWDVVASGPGDTDEGEFEICVPADGDVCKAGSAGGGAGQLASPVGVALDSAGEVYVAERTNRRIQKFSSNGDFVFAAGRDVVFDGAGDSAQDEQQEVTVAASGGSFRLGMANVFSGASQRDETAPLPFNASAAEVQAALNALPSIGGIGGSVSVTGGPGDAGGSNPYVVSFEGALSGEDIPQLIVGLEVGVQLSCSTPTAAETISYQWLRDGSPIAGATSSEYTTTEADGGLTIQCRVRAANANAGSVQMAEPAQVVAPGLRGGPPATHPGPC